MLINREKKKVSKNIILLNYCFKLLNMSFKVSMTRNYKYGKIDLLFKKIKILNIFNNYEKNEIQKTAIKNMSE